MKPEGQKTKETVYVSPCVECVEVNVEHGFQSSIEGVVNEGYTQEDGSWDM